MVGLMCLVKPQYALFVLWGALRREWRFAAAGAAVIGLGLSASLALYGWSDHVDYLRVIGFLSERGETYYPNESVNGLMNRLMGVAEPDLYNVLRFGPFPPTMPWSTGLP